MIAVYIVCSLLYLAGIGAVFRFGERRAWFVDHFDDYTPGVMLYAVWPVAVTVWVGYKVGDWLTEPSTSVAAAIRRWEKNR